MSQSVHRQRWESSQPGQGRGWSLSSALRSLENVELATCVQHELDSLGCTTWQSLQQYFDGIGNSGLLARDNLRTLARNWLLEVLSTQPLWTTAQCAEKIHPALVAACVERVRLEIKSSGVHDVDGMVAFLMSLVRRDAAHKKRFAADVDQLLVDLATFHRELRAAPLGVRAKLCLAAGEFSPRMICVFGDLLLLHLHPRKPLELAPSDMSVLVQVLSMKAFTARLTRENWAIVTELRDFFMSCFRDICLTDTVCITCGLIKLKALSKDDVMRVEQHIGQEQMSVAFEDMVKLAKAFNAYDYRARLVDVRRVIMQNLEPNKTDLVSVLFSYVVLRTDALDDELGRSVLALVKSGGGTLFGYAQLAKVVACDSAQGHPICREIGLSVGENLQHWPMESPDENDCREFCKLVHALSKIGLCSAELSRTAFAVVIHHHLTLANVAYVRPGVGCSPQLVEDFALVVQRWEDYGMDLLPDGHTAAQLAFCVNNHQLRPIRILALLQTFGVQQAPNCQLMYSLSEAFAKVRYPAMEFFYRLCCKLDSSGGNLFNSSQLLHFYHNCVTIGFFPESGARWLQNLTRSDLIGFLGKPGNTMARRQRKQQWYSRGIGKRKAEILSDIHQLFLHSEQQAGLRPRMYNFLRRHYLGELWWHRRDMRQILDNVKDTFSTTLRTDVTTREGYRADAFLLVRTDTGRPCESFVRGTAKAAARLSVEKLRSKGYTPVAIVCADASHFIHGSQELASYLHNHCAALEATGWQVLILPTHVWLQCPDREQFLYNRLASALWSVRVPW